MIEAILVGAVRGGTSMVFAGVGETIAERAGVINLGTEGSMLAGALAAYAVGIETGNPWLGAAAGLVAGMMLSLVHGYLVIARRANQIATGLAVTFLGLGLTSLFGQDYVSQGVEPFEAIAVWGLADIGSGDPVSGDRSLSVVACDCVVDAAPHRAGLRSGPPVNAPTCWRRWGPLPNGSGGSQWRWVARSPGSVAPSSQPRSLEPGPRTWWRVEGSSPWRW